ncbi:Clavaminate synthase-like protein [Gonapodya prolifera JEL478]|uniref:Clavaminate synthase-like protein n=1 Tax=Gonapodya prolifera (strain JEL478) TaxID=1344416 RepID=A0A139AR29_GONPJ|nr:Clavaminate synthase-like protein [Gonapodya prolifera JEL478]|eukprot:KXS19114.1 Clavaminate synthase-like protein [Gonapodya prolifera JEL478]
MSPVAESSSVTGATKQSPHVNHSFDELSIPVQRSLLGPDGSPVPFPLVLASRGPATLESTLRYIEDNGVELKEKLVKHGTILFRNVGVETAVHFDAFAQAWGWTPYVYIGGAAPRRQIFGSVFTTNEGPADRPISFHNEVSQSIDPPGHILFYCDSVAETGGETGIVHGAEAFEAVGRKLPGFLENLRTKGVTYSRVLQEETDPTQNNGRGWLDTYNVKSRVEAEAQIAALKQIAHWLTPDADSPVRVTSSVLPGWKQDPRTNQTVFFNSISGAYSDGKANSVATGRPHTDGLKWGDGTEMNAEELAALVEVMESVCVPIPWEKGDVAVIDNRLVQHSRRPYTGPRRVYASLWRGE